MNRGKFKIEAFGAFTSINVGPTHWALGSVCERIEQNNTRAK